MNDREIRPVYKLLFELMELHLSRLFLDEEFHKREKIESLNSKEASTLTMQTHLLLSEFVQDYSGGITEAFNNLVDICIIVGTQFSEERLVERQTENSLKLEVRDLKESLKSMECQYKDAARQIQQETEKEVDYLRTVSSSLSEGKRDGCGKKS